MSSFLLKETPRGSILVRDHLPLVTTKSAHFGWSLSGGSTVVSFSSSSAASVGTFLFMGSAYRFTHQGAAGLFFEINKYHFVFEGKRPLAGGTTPR